MGGKLWVVITYMYTYTAQQIFHYVTVLIYLYGSCYVMRFIVVILVTVNYHSNELLAGWL